MDLSFLKDEYVIGLNKIFIGFKKFAFYPKYYVSVNKKVLEQSQKDIQQLNCIKFLSNRIGDKVKKSALTHIINTTDFIDDFSFDIEQGLQEGYTVTYAALQIGFYLGFKTIIIIGMDHRFSYVGNPNESNILKGDDINHFSNQYFKNQNWDNPDLRNSEKYYAIANNIFRKHDRKIIDATVNGACSIFKKMDYKEIFLRDKCVNS